ncbi:DarT ssDNA thymidine ADP-ribosyltransferase family protein [Sedimentibacter sp.]|uniref:DarT ssDNA thymidine ADP-ribosyltransferase family protein n=1 Tax=Sedimentibacter sp. TaxID=1960295 RepID=UPI00289FCB74|nr:DarT ssDNA thymidine ADP-ribosyltransferase family protein [Sedimentibacter sp.]
MKETADLLHFTDFSNLNSIISVGYLCSRYLCYANNIEFADVLDEEEVNNISDKIKRCTRFYFVEKNNYNIMNRLNTPVYLLFNEDIIYNELAFLYDDELLIDEPVPITKLKNIIFRCSADYKRACNLFGKNKMYEVRPEMFFHDKNYIRDYNIVYDSQLHKEVFILHFSSNMPVKNDLRHEYSLYDLNDNLMRTVKVNFFESDSTDFSVEVTNLPSMPVKFKFWFYGVLSIEEIIG